MYHGYPASEIPPSCAYKIGVHAEEAQRNLGKGDLQDIEQRCWVPNTSMSERNNAYAETCCKVQEREEIPALPETGKEGS